MCIRDSSIATDGVSVSKSVVRVVQKKKKQKPEEDDISVNGNDFERIIAVDPGAKTPIVTCAKNKEDRYEYKILRLSLIHI